MRRCPKCDSQFDDSAKICRTCGTILDDVAIEKPPQEAEVAPDADSSIDAQDLREPPSTVEEAERSDSSAVANWHCPQCQEPVPEPFETCWNCGSDKRGVTDSDFGNEPLDQDAPDHPQTTTSDLADDHAVQIRCPECASSKMLTGVKVIDRNQSSNESLKVVVYGDPDALIFKNRLYGELEADICGDCGHVQLRVRNGRELYKHYLRSKR